MRVFTNTFRLSYSISSHPSFDDAADATVFHHLDSDLKWTTTEKNEFFFKWKRWNKETHILLYLVWTANGVDRGINIYEEWKLFHCEKWPHGSRYSWHQVGLGIRSHLQRLMFDFCILLFFIRSFFVASLELSSPQKDWFICTGLFRSRHRAAICTDSLWTRRYARPEIIYGLDWNRNQPGFTHDNLNLRRGKKHNRIAACPRKIFARQIQIQKWIECNVAINPIGV